MSTFFMILGQVTLGLILAVVVTTVCGAISWRVRYRTWHRPHRNRNEEDR